MMWKMHPVFRISVKISLFFIPFVSFLVPWVFMTGRKAFHTHHFSSDWWLYEPSRERLRRVCALTQPWAKVSAINNLTSKRQRSCLQLQSVMVVLSSQPCQPQDLLCMHSKARHVKGSCCIAQPLVRVSISSVSTLKFLAWPYQSYKHKIRRVIISYGCFQSWCQFAQVFSLPSPVRFPDGILSHHSSSKAKSTVWPLSMAVILHHLCFLCSLLRLLQLFPLVLLFWFSSLDDSHM